MKRNQVNTDIDGDTALALEKIEENFGTKPPAVVRLALKDFLPRFIAASGSEVGAANLSELLTAAEDLGHEHALKLLTEARRTKRKHRRAA